MSNSIDSIVKQVREQPELVQAMILKKLFDLEKKVEKKVAFLGTEEATKAFKNLHVGKLKNQKNYNTILKLFQSTFSGHNVADITAEECEDFLVKFWGNSSRNTLIQMHIMLKSFFNWCIKYLKKKGQPLFHNPCDLITFGTQKGKAFEMFPVETVRELIKAGSISKGGIYMKHREIMLSVMATTGMRPGEVCKLLRKDINGQIVTIRDPKSRRYNNSDVYNEYAVIPIRLADALGNYLNDKQPDDRIFISYAHFMDPLKGIITQLRNVLPDFTPHTFRKWVATFYERAGDENMVSFVLRHRTDPLRSRYVATLTPQEACERIKILEDAILKEGGDE